MDAHAAFFNHVDKRQVGLKQVFKRGQEKNHVTLRNGKAAYGAPHVDSSRQRFVIVEFETGLHRHVIVRVQGLEGRQEQGNRLAGIDARIAFDDDFHVSFPDGSVRPLPPCRRMPAAGLVAKIARAPCCWGWMEEAR